MKKKGKIVRFYSIILYKFTLIKMENLSLIVLSVDIHLERILINSKDSVSIFVEVSYKRGKKRVVFMAFYCINFHLWKWKIFLPW